MSEYTATKNMLIIKDLDGEIIGAQLENPADSEVMTFISPDKPEHTLYRVSDVPAEIYDLADPIVFQKAITDYVKSNHAKVTQTSIEELRTAFYRVLASREKK